jgi:hypothetical protein
MSLVKAQFHEQCEDVLVALKFANTPSSFHIPLCFSSLRECVRRTLNLEEQSPSYCS